MKRMLKRLLLLKYNTQVGISVSIPQERYHCTASKLNTRKGPVAIVRLSFPTSKGDIRPREMSVLERGQSNRRVFLREVSVLQGCLSKRGVRLRELSVLRDLYLRELSVSQRCLY